MIDVLKKISSSRMACEFVALSSFIRILLQILYIVSTIGLSIVGFNVLILSILYLLHRNDSPAPRADLTETDYPPVLLQLPIYNERFVVRRLIEAAASLDYPRDRLTVQILDDSTDETTAIITEVVGDLPASAPRMEHIRRPDRSGFKAGALAYGLTITTEPVICIFDADFVPDPDFLIATIPYLLADERTGMVQTRWAHLNANQSLLTRAQSLALDAHFVVEQTARQRSGLFMNFSGTAGCWRRTCIEDAGGWHEDTLSEDIDLSYRAQLRGWHFLYLPDISVRAEIPAQMMGFKRQQTRWATGTIQVLRKQGGAIARANISLWKKIQGIIHLGGYFIHPLMLFVLLLSLPLMLMDGVRFFHLAFLGLAMLGSPLEVLISQSRLYQDWPRRLLVFPIFMFFGMGIIVSNTVAFFQGLSGKEQEFKRTPKFSAAGADTALPSGQYLIRVDGTTAGELLLMCYAGIATVIALTRASAFAPFLLLYALGTGYVAITSIYQTLASRQKGFRLSDTRKQA